MRRLRHLRLSLVEGCLDTLQLTWEDARQRQLEQSSTDKLLSDFLQSPSDYTAVGLVTSPDTRWGPPPQRGWGTELHIHISLTHPPPKCFPRGVWGPEAAAPGGRRRQPEGR